MASNFEKILREAREKGEAKLKVIAPKYTPQPGTSYGRPSRGGGGSSSSSAARKRAAAETARKAAVVAKALALQKAQDAAAAKLASILAKRELNKISAIQANIIKNKGQINQRNLIDSKTRNVLQITEYRQNGNFVQRTYNTVTGEIKFNAFGPTRNGGKKSHAGVTLGGRERLTQPQQMKVLEYRKYQTQLNNVEKFLPAGVKFGRDARGNIVNIDDSRKGTNVFLESLQSYVPEAKLVSAGLLTLTQAPPEKVTTFLKRIGGAFSPTKFKKYREKQRQELYNLYRLTGKDRNFWKLANVVRSGQSTPYQTKHLNRIAIKNLQEDLLNPNTAIRAEAALIVAAVLGGPLVGAAVGAVYKTPIALAKENDVAIMNTMTWGQVAKDAGYTFGKNALQAYFFMKMFGWGVKGISKIPINRVSLMPTSMTSAKLIQSGVLSQKIFKTALKKGLDVVGAHYLASVGTNIATIGKEFKEKKYKAATISASALLGTLVGFYGVRMVRSALRKVLLREDPRLILTKGTKAKPFAIENRHITLARLNKIKKNLKGKRIVKFAKASPVKEPRKEKIVTPEKRTARGVKINVPTPSGYATYAVGKDIYIIPATFLKRRPGNLPKTYYTKWVQNVRSKGFIKTFKQLGFPKIYSPTIYKGSGEYLPRKRGETLKAYYARGLRVANKTKKVQVVAAPKTILGSTQPELEIKTIYPNPKGVKSSVTRVNVGKDGFGHDVVVEIVAPKSILARFKFKIKEKIKFKKEALKYLTNREAKIAKDLAPRIIQNYNMIYVSKTKGSVAARKHMLKVESNFRKLLKAYGIKATNAEIKAVSRLHDILKLRGINVKDEPIIRKAILEGYLNKIPLIKKLNLKQRRRVADTIGFHQDVNPGTLKGLRMSKFTKAFINADRLDITRYGTKVNPKKLFNLKAKKLIPKNVRKEFARINRLRIKRKGFTALLRKRYNSLVRKYPGLKGKKFEDKIIAANKAKYKRMTPKQKAKIRKQEKGYTDYKEAVSKYKRMRKGKKVTPYQTKKYKSYKAPKLKAAYRNGYNAGEKANRGKPTNYRTTYGRYQKAYASGYRASYKGNYKLSYKTGAYKGKGYKYTGKPPERKTPVLPKFKQGFKKRKLKKKVPTYYVVEKVRGRLKKLFPKPLRLQHAKDLAIFQIDNRLSRTAFLVPLKKSSVVVTPPSRIAGYYSKNKFKVRAYKIKHGKKKMLLSGWIEKKKFIGDTKTELLSLKRLRAVAKKRKVRRTPKRIRRKQPVKRKLIKRKVRRRQPTKRKVVRRPVRRKQPTQSKALQRLNKQKAMMLRGLRKSIRKPVKRRGRKVVKKTIKRKKRK